MNLEITKIVKSFKNNLRLEPRSFKGKPITGVEIDIEQLNIPLANKKILIMERPVAVRGLVIPLNTKDRTSTPNPIAFSSLARYIRSVSPTKKLQLLAADSDRGHIFALELGGPNCKYNIMPQWGGFQRHGDWRKLERSIKATSTMLSNDNNTVFLEISIEYLNLNIRDLVTKFTNLFDFRNIGDITEQQATKCLQVFGLPVSYSFNTYPCSMYLRKPLKHSLSISYIKYLYDIAYTIYQDRTSLPFNKKVLSAQKSLDRGWGIRNLILTDLVNMNSNLAENLDQYCQKGIFALSQITEEDIFTSSA